MKQARRSRLVALLLVALLPLVQLAACAGPAYYGQAISGHFSLMRTRIPVARLLEDSSTDPEFSARLRRAQQILAFASDRLALAADGSYSRVAFTGQDAVTWNVVAAGEFSVDPRLWCFPVAGCVPYRGYFDPGQAMEFANKMRARGFDVMVSPAIAYSTLGWFEDPLLDTMLQYSDAQLAGIMFHELAHERLYVKSDTAFSEAFAGFVEEVGVRLWMQETDQSAQNSDWGKRQSASVEFNRMLQDTRLKLQQVYASDLPIETKRREKTLAFAALKDNYQNRVAGEWSGVDYFAVWMGSDLNNAHLALMNSYEGGNCAFTALYEEAGRDLERFYVLSEARAALVGDRRKAWLEHPCLGAAHPPEL
ncbi:MAG TPA: aminopeptidase [Xanthomonadales bacterium]|nr:aminopeptidase [Xanthomonadales bacterium]